MSKESSLNAEKTSDEANSIKISNSVLHRLISGVANEEKLTDYENYWANKLAIIDRDHTVKNGLDISEAENMLNNINAYLSSKPRRSCPIDTIKITDCLRMNKGNTLSCEAEVKNFKQCIDKSLHEAVSKDIKDVQKSKKKSYLETFERTNIASDYLK
ncbi:unnamed protein product [Xylocopa violacea]|uniref:MICOS complex subunit MIC19 n=1 Tax=Xylocopa violacea TaxID=135666 RepID=A0ABP1N1R2_XYLVO